MPPSGSTRGQASVELVALLPLLAMLCAGVLQVVLVGHAAWAAGGAARAAARASAVGADARAAARAVLPAHLEHGLRVRSRLAGEVVVSLRAPSLIPAIAVGRVSAEAAFGAQ